MVEEFRGHVERLGTEQGGRVVLEKGDDATKIRKALRFAAKAMNQGIRFPIRGEEGSISFYLQDAPKRKGRPWKGEEPSELALPK